MLPRSLQSRLLLTFVTLMAFGLGGVILLTGWQLTAASLERSKRDLELQVQTIANALREPIERGNDAAGGGRPLDALISSYARGIDGRVTLLDTQSDVLLSSDPGVPIRVAENHNEAAAARNGILQSTIRWDEWSNAERLFVAAPIIGDRGQNLGFVQLSIPAGPIYTEQQRTWLTFLAIGGVVLLVTIIASMVIARQIAVPVQNLTSTSEQIAAGHLDGRVSPAGPNEIRRMGVAFNQMAERVQEMIAQQRAFVDNAAHELRSPLTSIRLRIEMLQTRGRDDAELSQHYLTQMEREVGYLQRMVDHLLSLASVETNERAVNLKPLDLSRILYAVTDAMSDTVQQAGLGLQSDIPEHLPMIEGNAEQMNMMIRNLIDNAIKYSRRGGTIQVAARTSREEIEIQVTDTGIGIPADALPQIFDRFYRVDTSHSRTQGGAGLGLALVRSIAQAHGGRVEVASRVNHGSTFKVYLPIPSE